MARTLVIGDIHGALKAVEQLLQKVQLQQDDTLIFLGDYVDGWSQSAQVIDYLIDLDKKHKCIFIKGNHDAWCEKWLECGIVNNEWLFSGGNATIKSYEHFTPSQKKEHLHFLQYMLYYFIDNANRLFIHAGYSSMRGPENERYKSNYYWDRTLWETARTMDPRIAKNSNLYPKRLLHFNEIYIGHTPTTFYDITVPMQACNVWNIDTGAAFNGPLSAMDVDTKQVWQSNIVQQLYPTETGRNK